MREAQWIEERIRVSSADVFLIDALSGRQVTYQELDEVSRRVASEYAQRGLRRGDRLVLLLENSLEFAIQYFAALYAGIVVVPLNQNLHPRELHQILRMAAPRVVVFDDSTRVLWSGLGGGLEGVQGWRCVRAGSDPETGDDLDIWGCSPARGAEDLVRSIQSEDLFSMTFTSGTTGLPKGVVHRVAGLFSAARAFNAAVCMGPQHRLYHVLPMAYMAGFLNTLLCPFAAGASVVIGRSFDAALILSFWRQPMQWNVNALWLVPSILTSLMKLDRDRKGHEYCRENIALACVGTAPLPVPLQRQVEERYGIRLLESYGLSETLFVATNTPDAEGAPGTVGRILDGVEIRFMDDSGNDVSNGREGEIFVRAPFNMAGYWDPERLGPVSPLNDGWFASGDLGKLSESGVLAITGRKKDLIIRGGVNLSPRVIEDVLLEHPNVEMAAVVGIPHEYYGEQTIAWILPREAVKWDATKSELEEHCRNNLGKPAVPDHILRAESFPLSSTGKIQKMVLREMAARQLLG